MRIVTSLLAALALMMATSAQAAEFITVASTTSTQNSGLFDEILPKFTAKTDIGVRVIAVGTGQAIKMAQNGDADVLFVHHRPSEDQFVADGFGVQRFDVMMNDFVVIGPKSDPAQVKAATTPAAALVAIAKTQSPFVSRGDDSGTHKLELTVWQHAAIDPKASSGTWYREAGAGMGATLNMAQAMGAYAITDRGTWIAFKNRSDLELVFENGADFENPYGVILVNPKHFPHIKAEAGQKFIDWLISDEGQQAIHDYKIDGQQLFFPTAKR